MASERYTVYSAMDSDMADPLATLVFEDGKLVDSEGGAPNWWPGGEEAFGKKFLADIKSGFTLRQFQRAHTSLMMVPEGGEHEQPADEHAS